MVKVFDNTLMEDAREQIYMFCTTTTYSIGWGDNSTFETRQYPCLHHTLTKKEWKDLGFLENMVNTDLITELEGLKFDSATINLSFPSSINFPHTHGGSTVLVYDINPDWKNEYYGETIFYDDTMQEATKSVLYKQNRSILFDGITPHSIRPTSHIAPQYRFTLGMFFQQPNFIEEAKNIT
jgi:hypothetical protein|tara:strand:- start:9 stop:551 length:543 start_codon:yes stop_codon:yes gene_type:complete